MSTIGGLFGSRSDNVDFIIDSAAMKIETKQGTQRWSTVSSATIIISKIKNPAFVDAFGSFRIQVFDQYRKLIAVVADDLLFTTTAGTLRDI